MLDYIKNILPRLQQYSRSLDQVESFVDKPWILIDDDSNTHEYLFLRDNRLILSVNGIVTTGKWELVAGKRLLVNRVSDTILLQHAFIGDGLIIMKLNGVNDHPFVLYNKDVIPDGDVKGYLDTVSDRDRALGYDEISKSTDNSSQEENKPFLTSFELVMLLALVVLAILVTVQAYR